MKERIGEFITFEKLTPAEFADIIGVQRSSVSHVLNGRNNPSFAFIQKMMEAYPKLNTRWLMLGEGEMYDEIKDANDDSFKKEEPVLPDLFSSVGDKDKKTINDKLNKTKPQANYKDQNKSVIPPLVTCDKTVKKVLIFYSDHTFEEYSPAD